MQGEGVRASMDASRRAYSRVGAHIVLQLIFSTKKSNVTSLRHPKGGPGENMKRCITGGTAEDTSN